MTRAAVGYPWTDHKSLAELWGLAEPSAQIDEQTRHIARLAVDRHLDLAARALRDGRLLVWAAHTTSADQIAAAYKVAWEDPARVKNPLEARHG